MRLFQADGQRVKLQLDFPSVSTDTSTPASDEGGAKWNMLFPMGATMYRSDLPGGSLTYDAEFFDAMLRNWKRCDEESRKVSGDCFRLPVDYFHRGESFGDNLPVQDKVASGWIIDLQVRPTGLFGLVRWLDDARELILADKLAYLSPTFHPDGPNKWDGGAQGPTLYGAALLNDPFLTQMPRVAASNAPPQENTMDLKQLCAILGIPETSAPDAILQAVQALHAKANPPAPPAPAPAPAAAAPAPAAAPAAPAAAPAHAPPAAPPEPPKQHAEGGDTVKLSAQIEKLQLANKTLAENATKLAARVAELEGEKADAALKAFAEKVVADKKVPPAMVQVAIDMAKAVGIDGATKYFAAMPALQIPTAPVGVSTTGKEMNAAADENEAHKVEMKAKEQEALKLGKSPAAAKKAAILANPKSILRALPAQAPKD